MPSGPSMHELDAGQVHYEWNHAIPPRLRIEPGDTVVFQTRDAADGYYSRASTHADVGNRGPFRGHPLTGPVEVRGAEPGDVLVVEVLDMKPAADFGWTAIRPGRGLLPESEFSKPFLQIWDLSDGTHARMDRRVAVPIEAFPGVMGTALDEPGPHSTMPPRKNGGNMDIKQLTRDSTLYLPVWMPGALFSVGDGHGAQGDGEVDQTAIETSLRGRLQLTVRKDMKLTWPRAETATDYITMATDPDLTVATTAAIQEMIDFLASTKGLTKHQAYQLTSIAGHVAVTQLVDAPNKGVHVKIARSIFTK
jgi:acetamidase/formamidase